VEIVGVQMKEDFVGNDVLTDPKGTDTTLVCPWQNAVLLFNGYHEQSGSDKLKS